MQPLHRGQNRTVGTWDGQATPAGLPDGFPCAPVFTPPVCNLRPNEGSEIVEGVCNLFHLSFRTRDKVHAKPQGSRFMSCECVKMPGGENWHNEESNFLSLLF
jgi:hypothetical protein